MNKKAELDPIQQEVFNSLMSQVPDIEKLDKPERLKAMNKLSFDIQAVIPPVLFVRMLFEYHQWNQLDSQYSSQD